MFSQAVFRDLTKSSPTIPLGLDTTRITLNLDFLTKLGGVVVNSSKQGGISGVFLPAYVVDCPPPHLVAPDLPNLSNTPTTTTTTTTQDLKNASSQPTTKTNDAIYHQKTPYACTRAFDNTVMFPRNFMVFNYSLPLWTIFYPKLREIQYDPLHHNDYISEIGDVREFWNSLDVSMIAVALKNITPGEMSVHSLGECILTMGIRWCMKKLSSSLVLICDDCSSGACNKMFIVLAVIAKDELHDPSFWHTINCLIADSPQDIRVVFVEEYPTNMDRDDMGAVSIFSRMHGDIDAMDTITGMFSKSELVDKMLKRANSTVVPYFHHNLQRLFNKNNNK